ncbi:MAG: SagB/ThcOx family dehydrogenase [Alphaproteobacteria bacterium]|nr:SagB/ThcOx family dehydrogenase [Alphaproteobacteria bacterium]
MNKIFYTSLFVGVMLISNASAAMKEKLNKPDFTQESLSLMELINVRHSERAFNPQRPIDNQTLSEILWVAFGFNATGKRTIPTARNEQKMNVYVLRKNGVWLYNAKENQLEKVSDENAIPFTVAGGQDFVLNAPIHLIYTSSDERFGEMHVGSAYQNVYLYAASKGLATVVRGMFDRDELHRVLRVPNGEMVLAHQPIGYPY